MNNRRTEESGIVAASPVVHESGTLPHRIVIRDRGDEYVVHMEITNPDGSIFYAHGDYFKKDVELQPSGLDVHALRKAWARFEGRVRRVLAMDEPVPDGRFKAVADIAESIINSLLPDDEDDCRDLIGDDYQLQSDIETFEQPTGKVIQPADDEPILGDEIELEDIERSL